MNTAHAERIATLSETPVPPIQPDDHIAAAAQKAILTALLQLLHLEAECKEDRNIDALRQFRAGVRRLQALLCLLEPYVPQKVYQRFGKRTDKLLTRIDDVHKLDLMMRDLLVHGEGAENRMAVAGIIAHMDAQRLLARDRLFSYMGKKKYQKFLDELQKYARGTPTDVLDIEDDAATTPHKVRHVLPVVLYEHVAGLRAQSDCLASTNGVPLSDLWDAVCDFQCLIETFSEVLAPPAQKYQDDLETLQLRLGKLAEVDRILDWLIHLPRTNLNTSQFLSLKTYRRNLQARRETLRHELPAVWATFDSEDVRRHLAEALLVL